MTHLPCEWDVLQKEALKQAIELWDAQRAALERWNRIEPGQFTWEDIDPLERQFWVEAQVDILSDLEREASRDFWVRWVQRMNPQKPYELGMREAPLLLMAQLALTDPELDKLLKKEG